MVHVSSDYSTMRLRPMGQANSRNTKSRRVKTDDILECEGGRLDPCRCLAAGCPANTVSRLNTAHGVAIRSRHHAVLTSHAVGFE